MEDGGKADRALSDSSLKELALLGIDVERHFDGVPQDIEWAIGDGRIALLQSRPITKLPAAPLAEVRWESPQPGATWVRRQVVEHMPEPLSPLFAELYLREGLARSIRSIVEGMGMGQLFDRMVDGPFFTTVNGYGYSRGNINISPQIAVRMVWAMGTGTVWLFRHGVDYWREEGLPPYLATLARWQEVEPTTTSDEELLRGIRELAWADAIYWYAAAIAIGVAKVSDFVLERFLAIAAPERNLHSGQFLRGFPSKTLEAEAELDAIAGRVRASDELREYVSSTPVKRLLDGMPDTAEGRAVHKELDHYFARYGHQIYNLDFMAPTLGEEPLPALLGLKALVREPGKVAYARQAEVVRERDELAAETARSLDWPRRIVFRKILPWAVRYAPYREEALFYVGAGWPTLRRFARELGRRLAEVGTLDAPDDVYFLESEELDQAIAARAAGQARADLAQFADDRRALREAQKRLHPPAAVPPSAHLQFGPFDYSDLGTREPGRFGDARW